MIRGIIYVKKTKLKRFQCYHMIHPYAYLNVTSQSLLPSPLPKEYRKIHKLENPFLFV